MIEKTLSYLDFLKILEIIKQYLLTPYAHESVDDLRPIENIGVILQRQDQISAVLELIRWEGKAPLSGVPSLTETIKRLSIREAVLEGKDFNDLSDFLAVCRNIRGYLGGAHVKGPFVEELLTRIQSIVPLSRQISKTVNPEGLIEDTASYRLSQIRSDLHQQREKAIKRLERIMEGDSIRSVLQDTYISIRNGRYVIPLKPNFNEAIQGIVHDYSHSLKTSFVEPVEIVELNNSINVLKNEELEEEKRILRELTGLASKYLVELKEDLRVVTELDFFHAIGLFSMDFGCVRPELVETGVMDVSKAMNPFIFMTKKDRAVAIDITIPEEKRVMIISGPNAGGKTAALKTIGLIALMAQSGLYVPAKETPLIPRFTNIYSVIGDEQDISMELSSFTAHMIAIKELYEHSRGGELILIDEIGGGTEPQEASALSMGTIDAFVEKGCTVIVTTHLNLLKSYGFTKPFAINVATLYDTENMKPLYRLSYGIAGYSNAISVARNIAIPAEIIEKSYGYLGTQEHILQDLIKGLEEAKGCTEAELEEVVRIKQEKRRSLTELKAKRSEYLDKVEDRCRSLLDEIEAEVEEIKKDIAKKDKALIKKSQKRIEVLKERFVKNADGNEFVRPGDYVRVKTLGATGFVTDYDKDKDLYEIDMGNARTHVKRFYIEKVSAKEGKKKVPREIEVCAEDVRTPELNLLGMKVEDALGEVDRFLDRAILNGLSKVTVLHGIGTGRLMTAVRNHLSDVKYVKNVSRDERNAGITVVELV